MEEWKKCRLGEICKIYGRIGFRGYTVEDLVENADKGAISLSPTNLIGGVLDLSKPTYISWDKYYESPEIMIEEDDVVIVKTGSSVGRTAIIRNVLHPMTLNPQLVVLKDVVINKRYLGYLVKSRDFQGKLASIVVGSAIPTLSQKNLANLVIRVPSIETQERIACILSALDDKIELNNRINHNLEEQARNIFLSYIDCDCVECPFSDLITVGSGGTPRTSESRFWNGDIPFFSPKDVSNSCFTLFTEKLITKDGLNNCNSSLYHENTTFITARGTVGKISLAGVSMAMNQSCFALTSKDNTPYFAYFLTERVVESLKKKANGAVFDAINSKDILQELVRVPNRDVIFQIEDRIRPYMNSIRFKSIENLYLTDTRDTLLPKLLSGELKINDLTC